MTYHPPPAVIRPAPQHLLRHRVAVVPCDNRLPHGYLGTSGNQIVAAGGEPVRITSVGWNQNFTRIPTQIRQMRAAGFNTIRISWVDATLPTNLATIRKVVVAATATGVKVIIDHHTDEAGTAADGYGGQQKNGLWYDLGPGTDGTNGAGVAGTVTQAKFLSDWKRVAHAFAGNSTVIGFDLDNEPTATGRITWGPYGPHGGYGSTDIHAMYERVGDAIQKIDPGALIIAEGPMNYSGDYAGTGAAPEGDLSVAAADPVVLSVPHKLVYSVHEYPAEISNYPVAPQADEIARMNQAWGYLVTKNIAPVWIGEMGSSMKTANAASWASTLVNYINGHDAAFGGPVFTGRRQPISTDWWAWGYLPGQAPDGTLDEQNRFRSRQQAVWRKLLTVDSPGGCNR